MLLPPRLKVRGRVDESCWVPRRRLPTRRLPLDARVIDADERQQRLRESHAAGAGPGAQRAAELDSAMAQGEHGEVVREAAETGAPLECARSRAEGSSHLVHRLRGQRCAGELGLTRA